MQKTVTKGETFTTVTLDGTECGVKFSFPYRVFCARNDGSSDIYMSITPGRSAGDDGVIRIPPGGSAVYPHMQLTINTVYIFGDSGGIATVAAQNDTNNPFKSAAKGGDFPVKFKKQNLLIGRRYNTSRFSMREVGNDLYVTVSANLGIAWYSLLYSNNGISFKKNKMYKLEVSDFTGYGRMGVSRSLDYPGDYDAYGYFSNGHGTTNGFMANKLDMVNGRCVSYFYINAENSTKVSRYVMFCSDANREDTSSFTFKIGLYEEED